MCSSNVSYLVHIFLAQLVFFSFDGCIRFFHGSRSKAICSAFAVILLLHHRKTFKIHLSSHMCFVFMCLCLCVHACVCVGQRRQRMRVNVVIFLNVDSADLFFIHSGICQRYFKAKVNRTNHHKEGGAEKCVKLKAKCGSLVSSTNWVSKSFHFILIIHWRHWREQTFHQMHGNGEHFLKFLQ